MEVNSIEAAVAVDVWENISIILFDVFNSKKFTTRASERASRNGTAVVDTEKRGFLWCCCSLQLFGSDCGGFEMDVDDDDEADDEERKSIHLFRIF